MKSETQIKEKRNSRLTSRTYISHVGPMPLWKQLLRDYPFKALSIVLVLIGFSLLQYSRGNLSQFGVLENLSLLDGALFCLNTVSYVSLDSLLSNLSWWELGSPVLIGLSFVPCFERIYEFKLFSKKYPVQYIKNNGVKTLILNQPILFKTVAIPRAPLPISMT